MLLTHICFIPTYQTDCGVFGDVCSLGFFLWGIWAFGFCFFVCFSDDKFLNEQIHKFFDFCELGKKKLFLFVGGSGRGASV